MADEFWIRKNVENELAITNTPPLVTKDRKKRQVNVIWPYHSQFK